MVTPCEARARVKLIQVRCELSEFIVLDIASRPPRRGGIVPVRLSSGSLPLLLRHPFFLSAHEMIIANVHATTSYTAARNGSADCKSDA